MLTRRKGTIAMAIAVYSRVGSVLRASGVGLDDLRARIASRYGLVIDARALAALAHDGRLQRPDIEILEAIARVLGVPLDDLLEVRNVTVDAPEEPASLGDDILLDPERDLRLSELMARRDSTDHPLTSAEEGELEALSQAMARALVDRNIANLARRRGISIADARAQVMAEADDAAAFWSELVSDPERMEAEVRAARERRQMQAS